MLFKNSCKCRYCGENIDYFFTVRQSNVNVETWITSENQRRADVYSYNNGYRIKVRCPNPKCNKINYFEHDSNGNYLGEL